MVKKPKFAGQEINVEFYGFADENSTALQKWLKQVYSSCRNASSIPDFRAGRTGRLVWQAYEDGFDPGDRRVNWDYRERWYVRGQSEILLLSGGIR